MEWAAVLSILVPLVAFFGFLYKELKEWRKETREETQSIRAETQSIRAETQSIRAETQSIRAETQTMRAGIQSEIAELRNGFQAELRLQTERSDKLYQMFIDLLKSRG